MSFREESRRGERQQTSADQGPAGTERGRPRPSRISPLLLSIAVLLLVLLAVAAVLIWRSFGESISGTNVARDSIDSAGPEPHVQLTYAAGQVRVEGVKGSNSVDYEATRYAMAADPAVAKQRASEVPVDISREGFKIVIETDGDKDTGADYALRVPAGSAVETGDIIARLPPEDTRDLILQTRVGSVLREPPDGDTNEQGSAKQKHRGS